MAELVKVVVDAMGGDNAPEEPVKAAVEAVKEREDIFVILTGLEDVIKKELNKYQGYPEERIQIVHTSEVIETAEPPVFAIRKKKDSSIVVGLNLVKKHEADAFVSSGSTGAVLVGGQVLVGRSKGVGASSAGASDPYHGRRKSSDRLRGECGRQTISSGSVCKNGFNLYGAGCGNQKPQSSHCQ